MYSLLSNKILLLTLLVVSGGFAQNSILQVDPNNTIIEFSIKHLGVLTVNGSFTNFSGTVGFKQNTIQSVASQIKVESIATEDSSRDETLTSKPYFDVANYPLVLFKSTQTDAASKTIKGWLTIKGVKRIVKLRYENSEISEAVQTNWRLTTTLSRKEFDLIFGTMDTLIGDTVKVKITITR